MSHWKYVQVEHMERFAILTLMRPEVLNALSRALLEELEDAISWVENNPDISVLIITGAGNKAFVAGADIAELQQIASAKEAEALASYGQNLFQRIEELTIPVIMAINGYALGGGFELAMCGDILLAAENARFGQPEVNLGIIPGYGGTQRLSRAVGKNMAKYLCFTGDMMTPDEAQRLGLVQRVVPSDMLLDEAKALAEKLAQKAPVAIQYIKQAIHQGTEVDLGTGLKLEAAYFGLSFNTEDQKEGMGAFLEKRKPCFAGR